MSEKVRLKPDQALEALISNLSYDYLKVAIFLKSESGIRLSLEAIVKILLENDGQLPKRGLGKYSMNNALGRLKFKQRV